MISPGFDCSVGLRDRGDMRKRKLGSTDIAFIIQDLMKQAGHLISVGVIPDGRSWRSVVGARTRTHMFPAAIRMLASIERKLRASVDLVA